MSLRLEYFISLCSPININNNIYGELLYVRIKFQILNVLLLYQITFIK